MLCSYCGLQTDGGKNHGTTEACIHALAEETRRLKADVRQIEASTTSDRGRQQTNVDAEPLTSPKTRMAC